MNHPDVLEPHAAPESATRTPDETSHKIAGDQTVDDAAGRDAFIENWLRVHVNAVALAVLAAGLGLRIFAAGRSFLNPDEAIHYLLINQPSTWLAYRASLTNAHPPLIYLIVYFWHFLGRSELMLRLPSVIAGTIFCWALYKWIKIVLGKTASMVGLIMAAFSPCLIALSAELRAYALLLCCMSCALYFLARAFEENSAARMWCFSIFLCLAILSHYSGVFFALAVGIYCLARIVDSRPPRNVVVAWAAGQVAALAVCAFLYVTHVSKIRKDDLALWASAYDNSLFHPGHGNLLTFTRAQTSSIFLFLFEQQYVAQAMLLLFLACVGFLFLRDFVSRPSGPRSWHLGLLLLLPFVAVWAAAVAGIYPYVGNRQDVFLAPFVIAATSFVLAKIYERKLWAALLITSLVMVASNASGKTFEPYIKKENQRQSLMIDAMAHIHSSVPRGGIIMADLQSSIPLAYYLCGPADSIPIEGFREEFNEFSCNGYSVISTNYHVWKLTPDNFVSQFERMTAKYNLKPGDPVWVFQTGWGANLDTELSWHVMKFRCQTPASFGENITVIPFVVGPDLSPALPPGSPQLTRLGRCSN